MAMGIGQQIKEMMGRARHYWAELTDDKDHRQQARHERDEDAVHQRYGGVRSEDEPVDTHLHGRPSDLADRIPPEAPPLSHSARTGEGAAPSLPPQGESQAQRQYTQQGGSGIQKTLAEQLGSDPSGSNTAPGQARRRSGQQNH